jgi:hypothetical protein
MDIKTDKIALTSDSGAGGVLAWTVLRGEIIIIGLVIDLTSPSTADATVSFGVAPNNAAPSSNLIDSLNVHAAGTFDNHSNHGASGRTCQKLNADHGQYVTGSQVAGSVAGIAGYAYISYLETTA